jgi:DNA-binding IclR family transcriptional regulator
MEKSKMNSRERILAGVEKLVEKTTEGMSNKSIAFELKTTEANICRDLKILEGRGWIEKSGTKGKWRMSSKFGGFAGQIIKGIRAAKLRLTEEEARYASEMVTIQSCPGDSGNRRNEGAFSPVMSRLGAKGGGSPLC